MVDTLLRKQRLSIMGAAHKGGPLPISEELGIGIAAAALSKLFSAPLSNIVTRKQTSAMLYPNAKPPSFVDIYQDIMREKGITGFWSGYSASLLLTLNPSITYIMYEMSKPHYVDFKGGSMNKFDTFFLAALCRAAATTLTYPMNVVRIRSQMEDGGDDLVIEDTWEAPSTSRSGKSVRAEKIHHKKQSDARYYRSLKQASGIVELISEIIRREGISALYVGLKGTLAKSFFSHSTSYLISGLGVANVIQVLPC